MLSLYLDERVCLALIAQRSGISQAALERCLHRYDVARWSHAYRSVDEVEAELGPLGERDRHALHQYLDCGRTLREVADMQGCAYSTLHRRLRGLGVRRREPGTGHQRLSNRELDLTRFLYEDVGMSTREIAVAMNRQRSTIPYRLRAAGIPLRPANMTHRRSEQQRQRVRAAIASLTAQRAA